MFKLIFLSFLIIQTFQLGCISDSGDSVEWFLSLKYPNKTDQHPGEQHRYAYYDSVMSVSGETKFQLKMKYVDQSGESLAETLLQVNSDKTLQKIIWNDEPLTPSESNYDSTAHSKGVIIYDPKTKTGAYIAHSTPKYPGVSKEGVIDVKIGKSQMVYGQNYLCMTLEAKELENLAEGLSLIGTTIYFSDFKDSSMPKMTVFSQGNPAQSTDPDQKTIPFKVKNIPFIGFFKNPYYTSGLIFENIMVPTLQDSLVVESWGRPYQPPSCNIGNYEVDNILNIQIVDDSEGNWEDRDDHSKWALGVDKTKNWVCSGDMNRMTSQSKRGGAFFCLQDKQLWQLLSQIVTKVQDCSSLKTYEGEQKQFLN